MLLHASLHWPDQADLEHWPFAVTHAVFIWNHIPRGDTSLSPIELFSGTSFPSKSRLQRLHVCGCSVFVFDPKIPHFVLALVKSLGTLKTIHVVNDDQFSTVLFVHGY